MSFTDLKRWIRDEAERMGSRCSSRQSHSIARSVWMQNSEEDDTASGLRDLNLHSDPTAREAVRRVMASTFDLAVAA